MGRGVELSLSVLVKGVLCGEGSVCVLALTQLS